MVRISDIQNNEVVWDTVPFCNIKQKEIEGYLLEPMIFYWREQEVQ